MMSFAPLLPSVTAQPVRSVNDVEAPMPRPLAFFKRMVCVPSAFLVLFVTVHVVGVKASVECVSAVVLVDVSAVAWKPSTALANV